MIRMVESGGIEAYLRQASTLELALFCTACELLVGEFITVAAGVCAGLRSLLHDEVVWDVPAEVRWLDATLVRKPSSDSFS